MRKEINWSKLDKEFYTAISLLNSISSEEMNTITIFGTLAKQRCLEETSKLCREIYIRKFILNAPLQDIIKNIKSNIWRAFITELFENETHGKLGNFIEKSYKTIVEEHVKKIAKAKRMLSLLNPFIGGIFILFPSMATIFSFLTLSGKIPVTTMLIPATLPLLSIAISYLMRRIAWGA